MTLTHRITVLWLLVAAACGAFVEKSHAQPAEALQSVVSVLPVWPGRAQGGSGAPAGVAPEGSGIVLRPGVVATAWHVIEPAERIDVRLNDGRILRATMIGADAPSDIALLRIDADVPPFELSDQVDLIEPACAIGNAFGLGLSVTCGVVSQLNVSNAGFNPVEDFVQTDAAINPGASGGALVDAEGHLIGMLSAIFASNGDTNTGVGFAVSVPLLDRVTDALLADGMVRYPTPGWQLGRASTEQLVQVAAPVVQQVAPNGPAELAGVRAGDHVVDIGGRSVRTPRDAIAALAVLPHDAERVDVILQRQKQRLTLAITLAEPVALQDTPGDDVQSDCPHPQPVCQMRQAVFPVSSFDPIASATRIGPDLLVTNRHVTGNQTTAVVYTPDGPLDATVVPSAYLGDLVLLQVQGLPTSGHIPILDGLAEPSEPVFAVGADIARQEVRVFDPGGIIAFPAEGADLGRLHVHALMQPGVSGGALVDAKGALVGINVGGGEGRFEALPISAIDALLALREDELASDITSSLGQSFADCADQVEVIEPRAAGTAELERLVATCSATMNHGQLLEAGRLLAMAGGFDEAIALHGQAVQQVPNSINARVSLLVSLQLAGRFADMIPHARRVMELAPGDPQVLRFAIQSGVWGGEPDLAETAYRALLNADPRQAQAARRFIDNAPPAPARR